MKAEQWIAAYQVGGREIASEFEKKTPPDLIVEVEVTNLDKDKPVRYAELGVREMWQVEERKEGEAYRSEIVILDLQARDGPREIVQSKVLPGLTATNLPNAYHLAQSVMLDELRSMLSKELAIQF